MHLRVTETLAMVERLGKRTFPLVGTEAVLWPEASSTGKIGLYIEERKLSFALGAQNINENAEGAYTAEASAAKR